MPEPWQQRVIEESKQLDERIDKLSDFLRGTIVGTLKRVDVQLLTRQISHMRKYGSVLHARIGRFK